MTALAGWQNFYVIVGSSAGALIGLQFVVLSLIASRQASANAEAGSAFATPTIVHFGCVLALSGILTAPWSEILPGAITWAVMGLGGAVYVIAVARRMRRQTAYRPQFEDWLFHVVLPMAAYLTLLLSVFAAPHNLREVLFGVGGAALLLLLTGIHNAWDAVTYHVFVRGNTPPKREHHR